MEIRKINLSKEKGRNFLPALVNGLLDNPATICLALLDDNEILGLAVYTYDSEKYNEIKLRYIYVREDKRGKGYAGTLLEMAEEYFKKAGILYVSSKVFTQTDQSARVLKFMRAKGFKPLSLNSKYLMYYKQDLKESVFNSKQKDMKALTNKVYAYNDLDSHKLQKFISVLSVKRKDLDIEENMDLVYDRYFVHNGDIVAYMKINEIAPNRLLISKYYVDQSKPEVTGFAIPAMIASFMGVVDAFNEDDTIISMQLNSDSLYEAIKKIFGEAERDAYIQEYIKAI